MKVVLDENLPRLLKGILTGHSVRTVQEEGLSGWANGELLARLDGVCDVFITADKNLRYQQNLKGRTLAIIELPTNRLPLLRTVFSRIGECVNQVKPGQYVALGYEE